MLKYRRGPKPTDWSKITVRICTKCGKKLAIKNFYWSQRIPCSWCKDCEKTRVKKWIAKNKAKARQYRRTSWKRVRNAVLEAYGSKCKCCGETTPEFLALDHRQNDGAEHRKQLGGTMLYCWLRKNKYPKRHFQLLCHNCNMAKSLYGKCPHKRRKNASNCGTTKD